MIELGYILNIAGVRLVFGVYNFYMHSSESVRPEPAALCVKNTLAKNILRSLQDNQIEPKPTGNHI